MLESYLRAILIFTRSLTFNLFEANVVPNIETIHLIFVANQLTVDRYDWRIGLKWVNVGKLFTHFTSLISLAPNLNISCVQCFDVSLLSKNHNKFVWSEKLKKHVIMQLRLFLFEALKYSFSKFNVLFIPSYIAIIFYYFSLVYLKFLAWYIAVLMFEFVFHY